VEGETDGRLDRQTWRSNWALFANVGTRLKKKEWNSWCAYLSQSSFSKMGD